LRSVGSSFDEFLREEGILEEVTERVMQRLENYATARDQERYAIALAKTYNKRRQTAYQAYLKEFDALQKREQFTEEVKRAISRRLDEIHQFHRKT